MASAKPTILVVEDEPMILLDISLAIEERGFAVVTAACCDEAFDVIDDASVDAAILDVNLGRGETCEPVAALLKQRGIPFFLHTGDLDRHGELLERLGARIIPKPAISEDVAEEVAKLVGVGD